MRWKEIPEYSQYKVSDCGRVWNKRGECEVAQMLTGPTESIRYYSVNMYRDDGERKLVRVHRLVAGAFCEGYSEENYIVDHIDRNPHNNHFSNLRWTDPRSNSDNRGCTIWYDSETTLKDYCNRFDNPDSAYTYIWHRLADFGVDGAITQYGEFLKYGLRTRKVLWKNKEEYLLDIVGHDVEEYTRVINRMNEGWDVWNAVCDVPTSVYNSFQIRENGVWYWYPSSAHWTNEYGKTSGTLYGWLNQGCSTEEILAKGLPELHTVKGVTGTSKELCEHFGLTEEAVETRISRKGMTLEEALSSGRQRVNVLTINGERKRPGDWSRHFGIEPSKVTNFRHRTGKTFKEAFEHFGVDTTDLVIEE